MRQRVSCPYLDVVHSLWDGELAEGPAAEAQAHLAACPLCQEEQRTVQGLAVALKKGDVGGSVPKPEHDRMRAALLERCEKTLMAAAPDRPHSDNSQATAARRGGIPVWQAAVVGLTAAILGAILFPVFSQSRERARFSTLRPGGVPASRPVRQAQNIDGHLRTWSMVDGLKMKTQDYDETYPTGESQGSSRRPAHALPGPTADASGSVAFTTGMAGQLPAIADSQPDRYLIKDATLTMEVKDARQATRSLVGAVSEAHGYVSDTHESVDGLGQRSVTTKVRVPFSRFDASMQQIELLGKVAEKQITAEDVTEEFVDSQAKLHNLQRTELRLLQHLNQTARLSDILLVEREVNRVRGEIEQLQGRLRFLQHRIAFSTITLTLSEAPRPQQVVPEQSYSGGKQASDAMRSLVSFLQVIWTTAIWFAVWAVVWIPAAFVLWLSYRRLVSSVLL